MNDFITPPDHTGFLARRICGIAAGGIRDIAIALIEPGGGGPEPAHTHAHDHLFIVNQGEVTIFMDGTAHILKADEALLVPGKSLHSVWNRSGDPVKMTGITLGRTEP